MKFEAALGRAIDGDLQAMETLHADYARAGHADQARQWALHGAIHGSRALTEAYEAARRQDTNFNTSGEDAIILKNLSKPGAAGLASRLHLQAVSPTALASSDEIVMLPVAMVGQPYRRQLTGQGGQPPHRFVVSAGQPEAFGLVLSPEGVLAGVPVSAGTLTLRITVRDAQGQLALQAIRVRILPQRIRRPAPATP